MGLGEAALAARQAAAGAVSREWRERRLRFCGSLGSPVLLCPMGELERRGLEPISPGHADSAEVCSLVWTLGRLTLDLRL